MRVPEGIAEIYNNDTLFYNYSNFIVDSMLEINLKFKAIKWKQNDSAYLNFVLYLSRVKRKIKKLATDCLIMNDGKHKWAFRLYMHRCVNHAISTENRMNNIRLVRKRNMKGKDNLKSLCDHFETSNID